MNTKRPWIRCSRMLAAILLALLLAGCGSQKVQIPVSAEELKAVHSFPDDVVFFTSASNPIKSLNELQNDEIAMWGLELLPDVQQLMKLGGRTDTALGFQVIGTGNDDAKFSKNSQLRLFVTYESFAKDILAGGGVRIEFVEEGK